MKLSARNFQTPLLRVLGKLSGYVAGVEIKGEDTYPGILEIMSLSSVDEYGENAASGQPQIVKWIQWANMNTRKAGQTEMVGRGMWALTDLGVQDALQAEKAAGGSPKVGKAPVAPAAPVIKPAPKTQKSSTMTLNIPTSDPVSYYHEDAYMRTLAIDGTKCFGNYSPHGASVCPDCPLRTECRNRQLSSFSALATVLNLEDQAAKPAQPGVTPTAVDPDPASTGRWVGKIDFSMADRIKNHSDAWCGECAKAIPKGERCYWVEQLPGEEDGALFHFACAGGE